MDRGTHEAVGKRVTDRHQPVFRGPLSSRWNLDSQSGVSNRLPWAGSDLHLVRRGPAVGHDATAFPGQEGTCLPQPARDPGLSSTSPISRA
jgi:hypothetical protein